MPGPEVSIKGRMREGRGPHMCGPYRAVKTVGADSISARGRRGRRPYSAEERARPHGNAKKRRTLP